MAKLSEIQDFLSQKRIAMVGVSRNQRDFSRSLFDDLVRHGFDVVPVNPNSSEIGGKTCFGQLSAVTPVPDAVLVMTSVAQREDILRECIALGIRCAWTYGVNGKDSVSPSVASDCRKAGMTVVQGECPYMFLSHTGGIHRFHGFVRKLFRSYPT